MDIFQTYFLENYLVSFVDYKYDRNLLTFFENLPLTAKWRQ